MLPERIARPLYFIAALFIATPLMDFAGTVWPLRLGNVQWRFGALGLLSGFLLTPMLGVILASIAASSLGHRRTLRVIGMLSAALSVVILLVIAAFTLDTLQLKASVPAENQRAFVAAGGKAMLKYITSLVGFLWLGLGIMKAGKDTPTQSPEQVKKKPEEASPFLVGMQQR
jgi:hypothetical protein